jgi:hypothetical protein
LTESTSQEKNSERLLVPPEVARLFVKDADPAQLLKVARGNTSLAGADLVMALFMCCLRSDEQLKTVAIETLQRSSNNALRPVLENPAQHGRLLDFVARVRLDDLGTLILLRRNPSVLDSTWVYVFSHCSYEVLLHFCDDSFVRGFPAAIRAAVLENKQAPEDMKRLIAATLDGSAPPSLRADQDADGDKNLEDDFADDYEETQHLNKQQIVLELGMAEKVKMAMTGDKEWRSILIKDSNKTVSGAVMKNPRITEGEILFLAQNRSSSEEVIREILLNREWVKNYAIRHALIMHPRTPLTKAVRFLSTMNDKDVRMLAKSRNVSSAIVNNCRRMIAAKQKR